MTQRILRLRGVPVFAPMTAADLAPLAAALVPRTFQKGEILLREDAPPRSYFVVGAGTVTMRRKGNLVGTIRAPGGVGFMAMLARNSGGTAAVAETYVEAYEVPADGVYEIFEDHFSVLLGTLRWITDRLLTEQRQMQPPPFVPPEVSLEHLIGDRELGMVERIFLLRQTRGFRNANVNSVARLARSMTEIRLGAGEVVWRPGDPATGPLFAIKGRLHTTWNDGKNRQELGPGYVIGGSEAMIGVPRWNTLVTDEPVVLLQGSRERLIDLMEDDLEMGLGYISLLAGFLMSIWDRKADAGIVSVGSATSEPALEAAAPAAPQ
jgi:CRP-like cAMP-binding protein